MGSFKGSLSVSGAGSEYAVTVAELKTNLRIDFTDDDTELGDMVEAAAKWIENDTNIDIMERTRIWKFNDFPSQDCFLLPRSPVQSITSIAYVDVDGNSQTLATSVYGLDATAPRPLVYLKYNQVWPTPRSERNSVTVTFLTGYANTGDSPVVRTNIPEDLRRVHLLIAGAYYRHRISQVQTSFSFKENPAVESILAHYRETWF